MIIEVLLKKKDFYNKDDMKEIKFDTKITEKRYSIMIFIYNFLSSIRQKINDPLGKKSIKTIKNN